MRFESPRTSKRLMPMETAIRRPCNRASYSAALLESVYNIWSIYWTVSPVGDVRTTPAPRPASILEPSKMHDPIGVCAVLFREFGFCPFGDEVSQYLDLMARRGLYVMSNGRSSMAHLAIRPLASQLFIMSCREWRNLRPMG